MFRVVIVALSIVLSSVAAQAQYGTRVALSGVAIELAQMSSVNPDCTAAGRPVVRPTQLPEHGRLIIANAAVFPYFREANVRSACNRRRVPGVIVKYVSQRGYTGTDSAGIEVFYPTGVARSTSYNFTVR
jgi:hypothetical protein